MSSKDERRSIRIGVSACLIGRPVRFNGGHCSDKFLLNKVAQFAELVPVCPEMDIGLGAPRETLRLVRRGNRVELRAPRSGADLTERMRSYAERKVRELQPIDLSGFVLKKDSPSCGMERVKVYDENDTPARDGVGLFAEVLQRESPLLPIEEEGRLNDARLRENFFERVFAYTRLRSFFREGWDRGGLVRFHTAEKLLLLSHDPARYQALGRLVATAAELTPTDTAERYQALFMEALRKKASVRRQTNVLARVAGHFSDRLTAAEKRELFGLFDDYRQGLAPLIAPLTLVRHYVRRFDIEYVAGQTYLEPHPKELMLRSLL